LELNASFNQLTCGQDAGLDTLIYEPTTTIDNKYNITITIILDSNNTTYNHIKSFINKLVIMCL
jgi:hypothetical protein